MPGQITLLHHCFLFLPWLLKLCPWCTSLSYKICFPKASFGTPESGQDAIPNPLMALHCWLCSAKSNESILSYQRMLSNVARTLTFEVTEMFSIGCFTEWLFHQKYPPQTFKATVNFFPIFCLKLKYLEKLQNSYLSFKPLEKSRRQGVGKLWNALCNGYK